MLPVSVKVTKHGRTRPDPQQLNKDVQWMSSWVAGLNSWDPPMKGIVKGPPKNLGPRRAWFHPNVPQCQRLSWRKWPAKMKGLRVSISHQHLSGKWSQVLRHLIWYSALKNLEMFAFVNFHDRTSVSNNLHSFFGHFWLVYHGKWY